MLDLQAGVHLHEIEPAVRIDNEFDRAGPGVIDGPGCADCGVAHCAACLIRHAGRRGFFQNLLMAPLDRAVPFEQVYRIAMLIAEDLDLDVPGLFQVFFQKHPVVIERAQRLPLCRTQRFTEFRRAVHCPHAPAAAARRCLEHDRKTDFFRFAQEEHLVLVVTVVTRDKGDAGLPHNGFGRAFGSHGLNCSGRRTDEGDPGVPAGFGKTGILREETVAWMDRLRAGAFSRGDQFLRGQVTVPGRRRPDGDGFIGQTHMARNDVRLGIHRDRPDTQALRGMDNAAGYLSSISDQYFIEHGCTGFIRR